MASFVEILLIAQKPAAGIRFKRLLLLVLGCSARAPAIAQSLDIRQYAHTAWRVQDGAPAPVNMFAQGADGVVWIASDRGLFQFDGVRFERFEAPAGQSLPPYAVHILLALPDTSLWIGYFTSGLSAFRRGRVVTYGTPDGLPGGTVTAIARDSDGVMWVATTRGLARLKGRRWEEMGPNIGYPGGYTEPIVVDRAGAVWVVRGGDVYVLRRGREHFEKREVTVSGRRSVPVNSLALAPDGSLWGSHMSVGLFPVAEADGAPPPPGNLTYADTGLTALFSNGDRPVVATATGRLVRAWLPGTARAPSGGTATGRPTVVATPFSSARGMSGDRVSAALYDREGTLWVGTFAGIDRFRQSKLTPVMLPEYVDFPAIAADTNGAVWVASRHGAPRLLAIGRQVTPGPGIPPMLTCIYRDLDGGIWIGGTSGLWERRVNGLTPVPLPPPPPGSSVPPTGREIQAVARDRGGLLWLAISYEGVYRQHHGGVWERFGAGEGLESATADVITTDSTGRTWIGYASGQVALVVGDSVRVLAEADGLRVGKVLAIFTSRDRMWVAGMFGVATLDLREAERGGRWRFVTLATAGEPLQGLSGVVETSDGELWLNGADGVARIPAAEVRRAVSQPGYYAQYERFDYRDGISPPPPQIRPVPSEVVGTDGRLWFATSIGVSWIDPRHVPRNMVPPPVQLRSFTYGGRRYIINSPTRDTLRLAPRTTAVSIAYTAYSMVVPERVRFQHRLEGLDTAWQEAGGRREAFYTNLRPGRYRFHVIAANDDGVWNTVGASLNFEIEPAWNQTWWFFGLAAIVVAGAPAVAAVRWQRRRSRLAAEQAHARFEATLAERTRVARELHDTLLSDMAGVAMQLSAGARRAETSGTADRAIVELLSGLGAQVQRTLVEARRSVTAMRSPPQESPPLHEQLAEAARRTFADSGIDFQIEHTGSPRLLAPTVEANIVGIATEAMTNARKHAECQIVRVVCSYAPGRLELRVRDNGQGFDSAQRAPAGHWGLIGMHERAQSLGAMVAVTSAPGVGTEVVLTVPGDSARPAWWRRVLRFERD